jgi:proline iminopeptidase
MGGTRSIVNQAARSVGALLDVGDGHRLYVEEIGAGRPAVFLHGGPGSGCRPEQQALFDSSRHRAILFDQRGAGQSRPERSLDANTTGHLVGDIERIRLDRGIDRWLVVGGSWGATLALAYAERFPERVAGLVLRSVFLGTRAELEWAFLEAPRRFRPGLLADLLSLLGPSERDDPLPSYWRRILDPDPAVHLPAGWAWHDAERILSEVAPRVARIDVRQPRSGAGPATPLFEAHYFSNDCFLGPDQLLANVHRLRGIPGAIIQGRYDLLCPPATSAKLADAWPGCEIVIVENAGHAMSEPGVFAAMKNAVDRVTRIARF